MPIPAEQNKPSYAELFLMASVLKVRVQQLEDYIEQLKRDRKQHNEPIPLRLYTEDDGEE